MQKGCFTSEVRVNGRQEEVGVKWFIYAEWKPGALSIYSSTWTFIHSVAILVQQTSPGESTLAVCQWAKAKTHRSCRQILNGPRNHCHSQKAYITKVIPRWSLPCTFIQLISRVKFWGKPKLSYQFHIFLLNFKSREMLVFLFSVEQVFLVKQIPPVTSAFCVESWLTSIKSFRWDF